MSRALVVLLVLAVLTAPAFAQSIARGRRGSHQGKTKGSKGGCAISSSVATGFLLGADGEPIRADRPEGKTTPDHPMSLKSAKAYVENQPAPPVLDHYKTTYDCVDSREPATDGTNDHLGTPGGDFAELATAIYTYCEVAGVDCSVSLVKDAFDLFMKKVATNNRPFYLHQSEAKINGILSQLFPDFAGSPVGTNRERPASMPVVAPSDAERWYEQLVVGTNQGCGHVRLMIQQPNDFGLDKWPDVVPNLLRIFYEYWWPTPLGSKQRQRIEFPILQGELEGDAVLVVDAAGKSGACSHKSPSVTHAWYGGQAFVYNGAAVADFRAVTLTNLFADFAKTRGDKAFGAAKFTAALQELQTKQLFAVLTELVPANTCPILTVSFQK